MVIWSYTGFTQQDLTLGQSFKAPKRAPPLVVSYQDITRDPEAPED